LGEDHAGGAGTTPLKRALSPGVIRQSLIVSAVVGTLLNCVNQGEAVLGGAGGRCREIAANLRNSLSSLDLWRMEYGEVDEVIAK